MQRKMFETCLTALMEVGGEMSVFACMFASAAGGFSQRGIYMNVWEFDAQTSDSFTYLYGDVN